MHDIKSHWAAITLTADNAVIVTIKPDGKPICLYYDNLEALGKILKKRHLQVKQWICSVPDRFCITKCIDLPANDISQAYKMLEFELSSHVPLPVDKLVYGCEPISNDNNLLKVLVYILKTMDLEHFLAKLSAIGVCPAQVMVDSVAIKYWFYPDQETNSGSISLLYEDNIADIMTAIHGSPSKHEFLILHDISPDRHKEEISGILRYLLAELPGTHPSRLKLTAKPVLQIEIKTWFEDIFQKIDVLPPPELIAQSNEQPPANSYIYESAVTSGLLKAAEAHNLTYLNLLPAKQLRQTQKRHLLVNIAATTVLSLFAIFCLWLNFAVMNWRLQIACRDIREQIAPIESIAAEVESKRQIVKAVESQLLHREQIQRIFAQLYECSPKDITISQMSYTTKAEAAIIQIKGQADTLSHAFEYPDALKKSEHLNTLQIINAQQIPKPGGSVVEFKAECTL